MNADPIALLKGELRPPRYIVNLDLPPRQRYHEIAKAYKEKFHSLTPLFEDVLSEVPYHKLVAFIARHLLRRVYYSEEQEEIKGIVEVTGMPLYLMIAFNTFLDTFMGCTSGAVKLERDPNGLDGLDEDRDKMVHFRTLDWGMDELRSLIIQIDYQRGGETVAQSITYAGFVGVLTGVRKDLSLSLNFRPAADEGTSQLTVGFHKLMVVLGLRPSIAAQLREFLIPSKNKEPQTLAEIVETFPGSASAPCYITLCDGKRAFFIEKDVHHAGIDTSEEFITGTNHDARMDGWKSEDYFTYAKTLAKNENATIAAGISEELLEDSQVRKNCIRLLYTGAQNAMRVRRSTRRKTDGGIGLGTVVSWCQTYPISNECTHFSCIMDPKEGEISWLKYHIQPIER
ncbi:hypothetical protein TWF694_008310 [Orbilia ellipsospora]|uniref:ceramidase n=1 Tax=Orbilia ellipsospora TaxID=2528407 RepID=A0AAV9XGX5_9PEZI